MTADRRPAFSFRGDPTVPAFDDTEPVIVMDATCALCSWAARWVHARDRRGRIRICPVQSPLGAALMAHYGQRVDDPDTWILIENGVAFTDSEAVIHLGRQLGGIGTLAVMLKVLPRAWRRWLYQTVARHRYTLFGRGDMCARPDPDFQKRLMR